MHRYGHEEGSIDAKNLSIRGFAQSGGVLVDNVKHRLDIRRRAGDHAQDLARRSLLLQRLFQFLKQPYVFDGDHGLVGEGFEQLDLHRCEGTHFGAT